MRRSSLTVRAVIVTCLVALLSVLVTAAVAFPLTVRQANTDALSRLNDQAVYAAELLRGRLAAADSTRLVQRLEAQGIDVYVIRGGTPDHAGLPDAVVKQIAADKPVKGRRRLVSGKVALVAGRPLNNRSGVVVTKRPDTSSFLAVLDRLWIALLAGLLAGLIAGPLLARRVVRPIRQAAEAAGRLSAGDHSVRIESHGPAEVDDLATALNELAAALALSEGRERDFLLSVSHELRTPLTTIKGYAEALADGVVGPDGAQRAGQTVLDEAERLDRLIADLLVLARLEAADLPLEFMNVDLTQLISAAGEAWGARTAAAGLQLRVDTPAHPVPVRTDPGRLRQVLDGLLENALRVVPAGAPVVLALYASDGGAVVEVRDGGPGFTDDDLAVAFERGALSQRYRGIRRVGSGLGLALAARLIRRLGGRIEAGHAAEGGARFTVRLQ
jgi:two-component system sensor histidine kinase BaeS